MGRFPPPPRPSLIYSQAFMWYFTFKAGQWWCSLPPVSQHYFSLAKGMGQQGFSIPNKSCATELDPSPKLHNFVIIYAQQHKEEKISSNSRSGGDSPSNSSQHLLLALHSHGPAARICKSAHTSWTQQSTIPQIAKYTLSSRNSLQKACKHGLKPSFHCCCCFLKPTNKYICRIQNGNSVYTRLSNNHQHVCIILKTDVLGRSQLMHDLLITQAPDDLHGT